MASCAYSHRGNHKRNRLSMFVPGDFDRRRGDALARADVMLLKRLRAADIRPCAEIGTSPNTRLTAMRDFLAEVPWKPLPRSEILDSGPTPRCPFRNRLIQYTETEVRRVKLDGRLSR